MPCYSIPCQERGGLQAARMDTLAPPESRALSAEQLHLQLAMHGGEVDW